MKISINYFQTEVSTNARKYKLQHATSNCKYEEHKLLKQQWFKKKKKICVNEGQSIYKWSKRGEKDLQMCWNFLPQSLHPFLGCHEIFLDQKLLWLQSHGEISVFQLFLFQQKASLLTKACRNDMSLHQLKLKVSCWDKKKKNLVHRVFLSFKWGDWFFVT